MQWSAGRCSTLTPTSHRYQRHCEEFAEDISREFVGVPGATFAVELGSNDGVLLSPLRARGIRVLGIEPAKNLAAVARAKGLETIDSFLSVNLARDLVESRGKANIILGQNVLNHIDDLNEAFSALDVLLDSDGVMIFEVPYLVDLVDRTAFDTMYHEMHSYFTVTSLCHLLQRYNMEVFRVKRFDLHAGSIRVYIKRSSSQRYPIEDNVRAAVLEEKRKGMSRIETLEAFARKVSFIRDELTSMLESLRSDGKRIVGYGAAAKGNVLLNYCGIGRDLIEYIVDDTPYKQGLYTPGSHIPIYPVQRFRSDYPDYTLLLAWNFAEEIMQKEREYVANNGRFIIPIPRPKIV